ncbi:hypothetical protein PR202_ga01546 [Eleusine coracana subsp. coracana]|uniref:Uncharacterized protein n=1 Tax=Eleusine coracana subsp. coracana TaxID=191504 RepID=A0AAV5BI64_ELECO|nr:hypothetical protein PR202_ga00859 [Eleusine coracana subsp. coracana]GJM85750.1 hypothetical protein PR202_ga01546 [Eleusine coracana subsp. coracana]
MENRRRRATRRLRCLLALAGDYLKYLFMRRRRLMHKVARKALALVHYHHHHHKNNRPWPCAITEHEFSCADSPSPAFLAAKRLLLRSRLRKSSGAGAVMSSCCFGSFRAPPPFGWREAMALRERNQGDDEEDEWLQCRGEMVDDVDDRAEEFINMFYQQLRAQSFAAVFQQGSP